MEEMLSKVYVLPDSSGRVTRIDGGYTICNITDIDNWVLIDEGTGDKYNHCQSAYLDKPITDDRGIYRYKLVDGQCVERTKAEMDADWHEPVPGVEAISDEIGNKYRKEIGTDGEIHLVLIESYTGELFQ